MTSFGKIEVEGPEALALLDRVCANRMDRLPGSVVYTQWCDRRGGIVADVTVTRLGDEHFRVVTGAGVVDSDLGWLQLNRRDGERVSLREASAELAIIGMWGPCARDVLAACTDDDVSADALPFRRALEIAVGPAPVLAQRITYVGELGFELYVPPEWAVQVWDARAGLGLSVALDKGEFNGRTALAEAAARGRTRALRTLVVGGDEYLPLYGGEAVRVGGRTVGRARSCAHGFTVRRNIAYAYLPADMAEGAAVEVEVLGEPVAAEIAADVLYDPEHLRVRG